MFVYTLLLELISIYQLLLLYNYQVLFLVASIALQVGIMCLYGLQLLLACINRCCCSAKLIVVLVFVLFYPYLVYNQFLVVSASYINTGASTGLVLQTVVASAANRILLLSVSATRQQYSCTLYAALAFALSSFLVRHQQLYASCLPQQAAYFLGTVQLSFNRQLQVLYSYAQQLYIVIALYQVPIQLQYQHLKYYFTQHYYLYLLYQKTLPYQIRPLLIILLVSSSLLNLIIILEVAFVYILHISYLIYLISTYRINSLLASSIYSFISLNLSISIILVRILYIIIL